MDELIKNMPEDTSEIRKKIVMQAADAVGKIPYYWGGSAKCAGYDGNDFGVTVAPDSKGRNKKRTGLFTFCRLGLLDCYEQ